MLHLFLFLNQTLKEWTLLGLNVVKSNASRFHSKLMPATRSFCFVRLNHFGPVRDFLYVSEERLAPPDVRRHEGLLGDRLDVMGLSDDVH